MLKAMVFRNFVHFRDKHVLNFGEGNGATYFIGASSTGKTAVLELVRRCMSSKLNSSVTNRFNEKEQGYVFCQFDLKRNGADRKRENAIAGFIVEGTEGKQSKGEVEVGDDGKKDGILSGEQKDEKKEMWKEDVKFHKIMIYHSSDDKLRIRSKSFFERDGKIIDVRKNVKLENSIGSKFKEDEAKLFIDSKTDADTSDYVAAFVEDLLSAIKTSQEDDTYDCYPALWDEISEQFVGILPLRGPGTIQWTRSKYISCKFRENNYNDVSQQAEIITELLKSNDVDHDKEDEIFDFLTRPNKFQFEIKGPNDIVVTKGDKEGDQEFPLLKASVGIVEAKQFALIMSHKHFHTICLEEPERGMHPQMIERMKEMLHRHCEGKTVIVVTHSPAFVDSTSIESSYVFFREVEISPVCGLTNIRSYNLNISEMEELKKIFFATRVLFVEGKSDKIIMQAIFRGFLQQDAKQYQTIVSHQIVELGGKENAEKLRSICKKIKVPCCSVLDRDKYIVVKDGKVTSVSNWDNSCELPISTHEFLKDHFNKYAQKVWERKETFFWKEGNLEDFLLSVPGISVVLSQPKSESKRPKAPGLNDSNTQEESKMSKADIKGLIKKGLSPYQSEEIGKILFGVDEVQRLCDYINPDGPQKMTSHTYQK